MSGKLPYMPWFTRDWLADPAVSSLSPSARAIWFDWLNAMHASDRSYKLSGTAEELARVGRCTADEVVAAVVQLESTRAADVHRGDNGVITVVSRRFKREANARNAAKNRQNQKRTRARHATSTSLSHASPEYESEDAVESASGSGNQNKTPRAGAREDHAEAIYDAYPRKAGKAAAIKAIRNALKSVDPAVLLAKVNEYATSEYVRTTERNFIPHPATWFNQQRWNDDPAEWRRSAVAGRAGGADASRSGWRDRKVADEFPEQLSIPRI